ncbi:MAG: Rv2175c family DNA-binding protein [Ancrocorticia sp.]|nr:Rv2175c family DNA-binding protein [Ancrocorticia sp.]
MLQYKSVEALSIPEAADALGVRHRDIRSMIADGALVGFRDERGFEIPTVFLLMDGRKAHLLSSLKGTVTTLRDSGLTDEEAVEWLLTVHDELGIRPIDALRSGNVHGVRRAAQLAF